MAPTSERLLVALTSLPVKTGELFDELPVHMPLAEEFFIDSPRRREIIASAMEIVFQDDASMITRTATGEVRPIRAGNSPLYAAESRPLSGVNRNVHYAFHSLISGLGGYDRPYTKKDTLQPRIFETSQHPIVWGETIEFSSVALLALGGANRMTGGRVLTSFDIGSTRPIAQNSAEKFPVRSDVTNRLKTTPQLDLDSFSSPGLLSDNSIQEKK